MSREETIMDEVAETIGFDAAMRIVVIWGGSTLYVPAKITPEHPIAVDIGYEAARLLSANFPSETITVPVKDYSHLRRRRFAKLLDQKGLAPRVVAGILGVGESTARRDMGMSA